MLNGCVALHRGERYVIAYAKWTRKREISDFGLVHAVYH